MGEVRFDSYKFQRLMELVGRLFLSDEQIVLLDLLVVTERALTEKDVSERLQWVEKRVREQLYALERQYLVAKDQISPLSYSVSEYDLAELNQDEKKKTNNKQTDNRQTITSNKQSSNNIASNKANSVISTSKSGAKTSEEKTSKLDKIYKETTGVSKDRANPVVNNAPLYWRVHDKILLVCLWKLNKFEDLLASNLQQAHQKDDFVCPQCLICFSSLAAQSLDMHFQDAHFLCNQCNTKLDHQNNTEARVKAESEQSRARKQFEVFKEALVPIAKMTVPLFPALSRSDKNNLDKNNLETNSSETNNSEKKNFSINNLDKNMPKNSPPASTVSSNSKPIDESLKSKEEEQKSVPEWLTLEGGKSTSKLPLPSQYNSGAYRSIGSNVAHTFNCARNSAPNLPQNSAQNLPQASARPNFGPNIPQNATQKAAQSFTPKKINQSSKPKLPIKFAMRMPTKPPNR